MLVAHGGDAIFFIVIDEVLASFCDCLCREYSSRPKALWIPIEVLSFLENCVSFLIKLYEFYGGASTEVWIC